MTPVDIIHLGAENCVTGSCHLVRFRPKTDACINILLDCGTAYGQDPAPDFDQFPVLPEKIDFLFLTHAQIDHIGRVPDLIAAGFRSENDLFFVGYQAKGTLGRRILEGKTKVNACVHVLSGYSAHTDQAGLVNWVRSMPEPPWKIRLVHGEPRAQKVLAKVLSDELHYDVNTFAKCF